MIHAFQGRKETEREEGRRERERERLARHSTHSLKRFIRSMVAEQTLSSAHFERYSFYVLSMEEDSYNRDVAEPGKRRKERGREIEFSFNYISRMRKRSILKGP